MPRRPSSAATHVLLLGVLTALSACFEDVNVVGQTGFGPSDTDGEGSPNAEETGGRASSTTASEPADGQDPGDSNEPDASTSGAETTAETTANDDASTGELDPTTATGGDEPAPYGAQCTADGECSSGLCAQGFCSTPCAVSDPTSCSASAGGPGGVCTAAEGGSCCGTFELGSDDPVISIASETIVYADADGPGDVDLVVLDLPAGTYDITVLPLEDPLNVGVEVFEGCPPNATDQAPAGIGEITFASVSASNKPTIAIHTIEGSGEYAVFVQSPT